MVMIIGKMILSFLLVFLSIPSWAELNREKLISCADSIWNPSLKQNYLLSKSKKAVIFMKENKIYVLNSYGAFALKVPEVKRKESRELNLIVPTSQGSTVVYKVIIKRDESDRLSIEQRSNRISKSDKFISLRNDQDNEKYGQVAVEHLADKVAKLSVNGTSVRVNTGSGSKELKVSGEVYRRDLREKLQKCQDTGSIKIKRAVRSKIESLPTHFKKRSPPPNIKGLKAL
jgi:hypothetical protein